MVGLAGSQTPRGRQMHHIGRGQVRHWLLPLAVVPLFLPGCSRNNPGGSGVRDLRQIVAPRSGLLSEPRWSSDGKLIAYLQLDSERVPPRELEGLNWLERQIYLLHGGTEDECELSLWVIPSRGGAPRQVAAPFPAASICAAGFAWTHDSASLVCTEVVPQESRTSSGQPATETQARTDYRFEVYALSAEDGKVTRLAWPEFSTKRQRFIPLGGRSVALDPTGTRLGLLGYDQPTRAVNLGIVELATGRLRQVTELPGGEGREVSPHHELAWTAAGRIYFTSRTPDPRADDGRCVQGGESYRYEIWSIQSNGQSLRRETDGPSDCRPAPDPTGKRLAFTRYGSIYVRDANGAVRPLVKLGYEGHLGYCDDAVTCSPDGEQIAFVWNVDDRTSLWTAKVLPAENVHPQ